MNSVETLETPAVTVRLDVMEANIARVQHRLASLGVANRPHIKTHKIPALAKLQMQAGAVGITCQKLGEVEVFADAGVADDVLLAFNIVGETKTDRLMELSSRLKRLAVVLDNDVVAKGLSEAGKRHGATCRSSSNATPAWAATACRRRRRRSTSRARRCACRACASRD